MSEYSIVPPPQSYTARKATFRLRLLKAFGISVLPLLVGGMLGGIPGLIASPSVGGYFLVKSNPTHFSLSRTRAVVEGAIAGAMSALMAGILWFLFLISAYYTFYQADDDMSLLEFIFTLSGESSRFLYFIVIIFFPVLGIIGGQFGARSRNGRIRELNAQVERAMGENMPRYSSETGERINPDISGHRD